MALLESKSVPTPPKEKVLIEPVISKGVTVDSQYNPTSTLTTYLQGQAWSVDYYSAIIDQQSGLSSLDANVASPHQQYKLIRGFELKVSSALENSQDQETKEITVTGTSNVYPVLIPNEGDMFIADIGDGREGVFTVTSSRRKSIYKETAHEIDYTLIGYNTSKIRNELSHKVVQTTYFDKEWMRTGNNPIISDEVVQLRRKLEGHYTRLVDAYFKDFFSNETSTFLVPDQEGRTYDPFIVKFLSVLLTTDDNILMTKLRCYNTEVDKRHDVQTIWDALLQLDAELLPYVDVSTTLKPAYYFFSGPYFNSIYYSKIDNVVWTYEPSSDVDESYNEEPWFPAKSLQQGSNRERTDSGINGEYRGMRHIPNMVEEGRYLFSYAFYSGSETDTLIEPMVLDALNGRKIDLALLDKLCRASIKWGNLERFYFVPVLLLLLKIHPRGL